MAGDRPPVWAQAESVLVVDLVADAASAGTARAFVAAALATRDASAAHIADVVLVASELVTNAVRYGVGPVEVALQLGAHRTGVDVAADGGPPSSVRFGEQDTGRYGLRVVDALSAAWGAYGQGHSTHVWAQIPR